MTVTNTVNQYPNYNCKYTKLINRLSCVQFFIVVVGAQNFILLYCFGAGPIFHSSLPLYCGIHVYQSKPWFSAILFLLVQLAHLYSFLITQKYMLGTILSVKSCDRQTSTQSWAAMWSFLKVLSVMSYL